MTRIFQESFLKNIERIDSQSRKASERTDPTEKPIPEFSSILADLENRSLNTGLPSKNMDQPTLELDNRAITNLTIGEKPTEQSLKSPPISLLSPAPKIEASGESRLSKDVKGPVTDVKIIAHDKSFSPKGVAINPGAPELLVARRAPASRIKTTFREPSFKADELAQIISTSGRYHGVDPHLSLAVAQAESALKPDAVSRDGHHSKGLFQLLDSTGKDMMARLKLGEEYDPFDPAQNTHLGVAYLRRLHDLFSEKTILTANLKTHPASSAADLEKLALAAYNAGEGRVARAQSRAAAAGKDPGNFDSIKPYLPAITQKYVGKVLDFRLAYTSSEKNEGTA